MIASVRTGVLRGVEAISVDAEVVTSQGNEDSFVIVGLGDSAVRESRERVRTALRQSGFDVPNRILVNLSPAELRKEGAGFDCAIAVGVLAACGQIPMHALRGRTFFGELALDGRLKAVRGVVSLAFEAHRDGSSAFMVAEADANNAALIHELPVYPFKSLRHIFEYLNGYAHVQPVESKPYEAQLHNQSDLKIDDVRGQSRAKRALTIAAAGGHNLLMVGPPGCGKSMLAARLPSLLPPLSEGELLEVARVYSSAGLSLEKVLNGERPFRAPHHGGSEAGLVGGGTIPRPGEITLAHRGVMFMDEFPEFHRSALEALRAPLESGEISIVRSRSTIQLPARFQLIAAMNPCPCGRLRVRGLQCRCSAGAIAAFMRKLSQPILDRIDLHVELEAVPLNDLVSNAANTTSVHAELQELVLHARHLQAERQGCANSELQSETLIGSGGLAPKQRELLERACGQGLISARGIIRVLRVARTIADLEQVASIATSHLAEALSYRVLERYSNSASFTPQTLSST